MHSAYRRTVADLPLAGATLFLYLQVRRFFCRRATCPRRIFAERFLTLVPVRGRHSLGVYSALRHVGLMVGGRAGVRLTQALGLPGSFRTIVRLVHDAPFPPLKVPQVIGLDEWAWRRGRRFGTMICDLERHQVVDLLPERTAPSVAQWLRAHPSVEILCRDRSGLYAERIRQGAPQAIQVVDRFHLMQNLRDALERPFLRYRRDLNTLEATGNRPAALTPTLTTISQARHTRWVHRYHRIQRLHAQHLGIAAIARRVVVGVLTHLPPWQQPILTDATHPLHGRAGTFTPAEVHGLSTSQFVAQLAPGAKVVTAINRMLVANFAAGGDGNGATRVASVSADDADAKRTVGVLLRPFGFAVTD